MSSKFFSSVANDTFSDPDLLNELELLNSSTMIAAFNDMAHGFKEENGGYNETDFNSFVQTYLSYKHSQKDRFVIENIIDLCQKFPPSTTNLPFKAYVKEGIWKTFEITSPKSQRIRDIEYYYKILGIHKIKGGATSRFARARASPRKTGSPLRLARARSRRVKKRVIKNRRPSRRTTRSRIRNE